VKAVVYAAKSTEDRAGSIPSQLADCRALAEREGWEVVGEFKDENFSAYTGNRGPGLEAAKHTAAEAAECVLLTQHSDRFARGAGDAPGDADHLIELHFWARRHGVRLWTVSGGEIDRMRAFMEGERNTEDSKRKAEAVSRGKDRQIEQGTRLGGPVPDGLRLRVQRDDMDRVVSRRYARDPERAPVIERIFELSEHGIGDGEVARALNREGHRTKRGGPWSRRRVQDTLLNPVYAGRVVRRGRGGKGGYRRLDEPEVSPASNVEPLVDPERFDRIRAMRAERDRPASGRPDPRGRPTATRYVLSKLAVCGECGSPMYAQTSPYRRKRDGLRARRYVCREVKGSTGECTAPLIDAELVDAEVISYLDQLFVDYEAWMEHVAEARGKRHEAARAALDEALSDLDGIDRGIARAESDYLDAVKRGLSVADDFARMVERLRAERRGAEQRVSELRQALDQDDGSGDADAMLDVWNDLKRAVRGGDGVADINERLRSRFEFFRLLWLREGLIHVQPVLRGPVHQEPILTTGEPPELPPPPARPLALSKKRRDTQG
jgi:site-specific DNA recombinase